MMVTGPPILPAGELTWVSAPGPRVELRGVAPRLAWAPGGGGGRGGGGGVLAPPPAGGGGEPTGGGGSAEIMTGPPILPAGKLMWVSAPGPRLKLTGVAPGRLTVPLAVVVPGLMTWMLSPTMPAVERSNQLR